MCEKERAISENTVFTQLKSIEGSLSMISIIIKSEQFNRPSLSKNAVDRESQLVPCDLLSLDNLHCREWPKAYNSVATLVRTHNGTTTVRLHCSRGFHGNRQCSCSEQREKARKGCISNEISFQTKAATLGLFSLNTWTSWLSRNRVF